MSLRKRILGDRTPDELVAALDPGEHIVGFAEVRSGGQVAVTALGLWIPGPRRIGWHLVSKVTWTDGLTVIEAEEHGQVGEAVVLADLAPVRFTVEHPGKLPKLVHQRVEGGIRGRHRHDLDDGGGAWFVRRKIPGRDGTILQARPDAGTDPGALDEAAAAAATVLAEDIQ